MEDMLVQGRGLPEIKKEIMREFDVAFNDADRLVRTEAAYVLNQANMAKYKRAGVKKVEWSTGPEDGKECAICAARGGKVYFIDNAPMIPAHPRCRCIYAGVVELDGEDVPVDGPAADAAPEVAKQEKKLQREAGSGKITVGGKVINTRIRLQKQNEHVFGTKAFERRLQEAKIKNKAMQSAFYEGTNVEELVRPHLGTGKTAFNKDGSISEFISFDIEVGQVWLMATRKYVPTSRVCVKYSKDGWHAYPVYDKERKNDI